LAIAPSAIRDWLAGDNNGVAIISEQEGADAAGLAVFAAPNHADANLRPTLKVNYSL
jgi:signal recognition particle GTPase